MEPQEATATARVSWTGAGLLTFNLVFPSDLFIGSSRSGGQGAGKLVGRIPCPPLPSPPPTAVGHRKLFMER